MADEVNFPRGAPASAEVRRKDAKDKTHDKKHKKHRSGDEDQNGSSRRKKEANLFQASAMDVDDRRKSKKSKKSKSTSNGEDEEKNENELKMTDAEAAALKGIAAEAPRFISLLRYTMVEQHMQMLGAVREVHELSALIALPNGMKGKLNLTEYSDSLTEHITKQLQSGDMDVDPKADAKAADKDAPKKFPTSLTQVIKPGQILRLASITSNEDASTNKQLELSTRESILNNQQDSVAAHALGNIIAASVRSVEDHGYSISTGIAGISGFLPFTNVSKNVTLAPGQRVDLTVASVKSSMLTFKYDAKIALKETSPEQVVAVDSLYPGMLVKATVNKVLGDGLWLNFLGYFNGSVDIHHVAHTDDEAPLVFTGLDELTQWFPTETTLQARILHIHPETKRIALTLLPHLVSWTPAKFDGITTGDRFEKGEIRRVDEKHGLAVVVSLNSKSKVGATEKKVDSDDEDSKDESEDGDSGSKVRAYIPIAKVSDSTKERLSETHYAIGSSKKVRVFGTNVLEGTLLLTHRKSDWKDPYLSYADLKVGDIVEGTIKSLNSKGAVVSLSTSVEAFCPRSHLSDVEITDVEARFKVGSAIKARVLRVSIQEGNAFVTFKKTIVKSTLAVIADYAVDAGVWAHGTIVAILGNGMLVSFYNDVRGFIPLHELNTTLDKKDTANPDSAMKALRTIFKIGQVVKVRVVEANANAERLTVSLSTTVSATQSEKEQARDLISTFKLGVTLKNLEITKREAEEGLYCQYKDESTGTSVQVIIPLYHLSDHKDLAKNKLETFKIGQKLPEVLVIARRRQSLVGTFKSSIIAAHAAGEFPFEYEQVEEGKVYTGYFTRFFDTGALVRFGDNFCVFVAKAQIALGNHHVSSIEKDFYLDQTVRTEILRKDAGKMQATGSLKSAVCVTSDASHALSFLKEQQSLMKKKRDFDWSKYTVGTVIKGKVTKVETWGVMLDCDGLNCFAHPAQVDGGPTAAAVGATFSALILDVNTQKGILDVSIRSEIVKKFEASKSKAPSAGTNLDAIVQLVKRDYLVMTVKSGSGFAILYGPSRDYNNENFVDAHTKFKTLTTIKVTVDAESFNGVTLAHPASAEAVAAPKAQTAFHSAAVSSLADIEVGKVIDGSVLVIHAHRIEFALGARLKGFLDISQIDEISLPKKDCTVTALVASHPERSGSKKSKKSSNLASELEDIKLPSQHPFARFKVGQVVKDLRVQSVVECKSDGTFVEGLKRVPSNANADASAPSKYQVMLSTRKTDAPTFSQVSVGQILPFWINQITSTSLNGVLGPSVRAYCSALESSHSASIASALSANFKAGQVVLAAVTDIEKERQKVHVSIRACHVEKGVASSSADVQVGDTTVVKISGFKMPFLRVQLFGKVFGRVHVTELADTFVENPVDTWTAKEGQYVEAKILSLKNEGENEMSPSLTLRKSAMSSSRKTPTNPSIASYTDVEAGSKLSGYIIKHNVEKKFCFVALGPHVVGHLPYAVIGDSFTKDPEKKYPVGTLVAGTALKVDAEAKKIDFAMRERSEKGSEAGAKIKFDDLEVGSVVKGVVGNIQAFGVFVKINKSKISALCHVSALQDATTSTPKKSKHAKKEEDAEKKDEDRMTIEEIQALFKVGDKVTAVVVKKDATTKKVSLSMKASDIIKAKKNSAKVAEESDEEKMDVSSSSSAEASAASSASSGSGSGEEDEDEQVISKALQKSSAKKRKASADVAIESSSEGDMEVDEKPSKKSSAKKTKVDEADSEEEHISFQPNVNDSDDSSESGSDSDSGSDEEDSDEETAAGISSTVQWDDLQFKSDKKKADAKTASKNADWNMDTDSESGSEEEKSTPQKKTGKKSVKEEIEEEANVSAKERALLKENKLETDADFERGLMSAPNSSYFWSRWVAQKVHEGNLKKAREIAERALTKIDDHEVDEKFNVWVVYLNVERQYGTVESFAVLLRRAESMSKPKPIATEAIRMLLKADRRQEAEEIYQRILRRYKHCVSSWVNWAVYHFEIKKADQARDILNKSLKSIAPRKHLKLLTKFAQLEFKHGNAERGRTIYETLLGNHPKRTDFWFVYIDMELKYAQDVDRARQIYERMITLDLNPTKMKPIFKKFLAFESSHGTPETFNHVKAKASEYIAKQSQE